MCISSSLGTGQILAAQEMQREAAFPLALPVGLYVMLSEVGHL